MKAKPAKKKVSKKSSAAISKKQGEKKAARGSIGAVPVASADRKRAIPKPPPRHEITESGLFMPTGSVGPVPASKLRIGFKRARVEINSVIGEVVSTMTENYIISEIELSASFSADGKFMGFGVGGAATIKIKIRPE